MLQNIRNNIQGTMAKVIIAIIIVPFALFGIDSLVTGDGTTTVAVVGDEEITENDLLNAINLEKRRLLNRMGDDIDPSLLEDSRLRGPALENLINQQLLLNAAEQAGMRVGQAAVDQNILNMEQFQQDGQFSKELYQSVLRSQGYSPGFFKQLLKDDILMNQLTRAVGLSAFLTPKQVEEAVALLAQKRSFEYTIIDSEALLADVSISDEAAKTYYENNQDEFLTEEKVKLNYIELALEDFYEPIDEERLRAEYNTEKEAFTASVERHAAHILLEITDERDEQATRALARDIRSQLNAGEDFAALAKEYSEDLGSSNLGGDLGYTSGDTFPDAFEDALASLDVGEVSEPVETDAGIHLIKLLDEQGGEPPTFEQRRAAIEQRLQREQAEPALISTVEELKDLTFNSADLKTPAEELDLTVEQSGWVSQSTNEGLFANAPLKQAAFSAEVLEEGYNSNVIEISPNRFVVLRVKGHEEPSVKPFAQVKPDIVKQLKQEKATAIARERATDLLDALLAGKPIDSLETDQQWQSVDKALRSSVEAPQELVREVFSLPHPGDKPVADKVTLNNGDVALVRLTAVEPGTRDSLQPQEIQVLKNQVLQARMSSAINLFMASQKASADINIVAQ